MSTKPTVKPEWATLGIVVEPPSLKKLVGWVAGEEPPAEYLNWILITIYHWIQWLDSSPDFSPGNVEVTGTLLVDGVTTMANNLTVNTGHTVTLSGNTTLTVGTGATVLGGTLAVTGATSVGSTLGVTGASTLGGTLAVTGVTTLGDTVTVASNKNITLQGTGRLIQGTRTVIVPMWPQFLNSGGSSIVGNVSGPLGTINWWGLTLQVGWRITAVRFRMAPDGGGTPVYTAALVQKTDGGSAADIGTAASSGNSRPQTLSITGLTLDIVAGNEYGVELRKTSGTGTGAGPEAIRIEFDYIIP